MSESIHRLDIEVRERGAVVRGELDAHAAEQLSSALDPLIGSGRLVIDLTAVSFIDSSGLAALLEAHRSAGERGGSVVLVPSSRVSRLIRISGLDEHLHIDQG